MNQCERPAVYRHELKHYINLSDYYGIRQRLKAVVSADCHAGADGTYQIRSLYFETPDNKALREKLYGIDNREKFRLRYYNHDFSVIRLEKKSKTGGLGMKRTASLSKFECEKLIEGDLDWMTESSDPLILELYTKMHFQRLTPKTVVEYVREPYFFRPGNVRITIDREIKTGIHSKDFFNPELPMIRTNAENIIILEVKYDAFLPDVIRDIVQLDHRSATAFSKYAAGRLFD